MKPETLKKVVELADGFEIAPGIGLTYRGNDNSKDFYPLLLRRAVEGWNQKHWTMSCTQKIIYLKITRIEIVKCRKVEKTFIFSNPKTDYLTVQEEAIEACLIELLEA